MQPDFIVQDPDGKRAVFLDSHMLSLFGECETEFYHRHILCRAPKGRIPFTWAVGQWWSETMSAFYEGTLNRSVNFDKADAMMFGATHWINLKMDDYATISPKQYNKFGGSFMKLPYKGEQIAIPSGAINMVSDYYDNFYALDRQNWKVVATEAGFGLDREVLIGETTDFRLFLTGRIDLSVLDLSNRLFPIDHKTKDAIDDDIEDSWKPGDQFPGYCIATEAIARSLGYQHVVTRFEVIVAARSEPSVSKKTGEARPRFKRLLLSYSPEEFDEWRSDQMLKADKLLWALDHDKWMKNKNACHIYSGCSYKPVCRVGPSNREAAWRSGYVQVEPWKPYKKEAASVTTTA